MAIVEPCILYAIRFASDNPVIRVDANGSSPADLTLAVTAGTDYFLSGNGTGTDLCEILETCLESHTESPTVSVTLDARNILTISSNQTLEIFWAHANTTVDSTIFGFADATDGPATTLVSDYQTRGFWTPSTTTRATTWAEDTRNEPITNGVVSVALDGSSRGYRLGSAKHERTLTFSLLERSKILTDYAAASEANSTFEEAWQDGISEGRTLLVFDDRTDRNTYNSYRIVDMARPWRKMDVSKIQRYEMTLRLREP